MATIKQIKDTAGNIHDISVEWGNVIDKKTIVGYGTCDTAAATAAKVVTISDTSWTLAVGSIIGIKYTNSNTASSVTLNVNNTGAKNIWYNNAKYTGSSSSICGYASRVIYYMYDGTYWVWLNMSSLDGNSDTKTSTSEKASTKLFLVGATSQSTSGQTTYSNSKCYVGTDNCLYSNGTKVLTSYSDDKVTSEGNHYTPTTNTSSTLSVDASGGTAAWSKQVVTGVNIERDSKGHITGLSVDSAAIPANPNTDSKTSTSNKASTKLYLVGAETQSTSGQTTYSNSNCYVGTDNCLYSNGSKVLTSHDGDTKNTTGTTNKASTKLFLAGAETQATNPVTYSNSTCYIGTDNCLYSNGAKVLTSYSDDKVTSAANHYSPTAETGSELTASLSGTAGSYAKDTEYTVLTGVKAQRDSKGHVTGITYTAQKIKDTNTTYSSLKNPNAIKFKNTSGTVVTYDGSSAADLSGGVYYAATAGTATTAGTTDSRISYTDAVNGAISPIDAAHSNLHSANRLAFAKAAGITIEYSRDNGSTWTAYSASDESKIKLVSGIGNTFAIGSRTSGVTIQDKLRVTIDATNCGIYTSARKFLLNITTNGAGGSNVKLEYSKKGSETTWVTQGTYNLTGWSGWNSVPFQMSFGGGSTQTANAAKVRFTFGITSLNASYSSALSLIDIYLVGHTYWTFNSELGKSGHIYTYDYTQAVTFPANVSTKGGFKALNADGTVKSGFLKADGTVDTSTYNNYTHPSTAGNKHIPAGGSSGQFLGWESDGTAKWVANPNTDAKTSTSNKASTKLYLVGAETQASTGQTTYSNSNCYVGTDNCLYSNGAKVLTSHDGNDKNTTGTTNKASTKLFLAGAETQAANPVTYSNSNCYIGTDNCLYSNGSKVLTSYSDDKVTSAANHYVPTTDTSSKLSADASGGTAAWSTQVVTGVNIERDSKGHITGLSVDSAQIPGNPNTDSKTSTSNKASTKLYLVGAETQSTSGQTTYSNSNCYVGTDNCLYSNGSKVLTSHDGNDDTKNTTGTTNKASTKLFLAGAETQAANPVTYSNSNCYIGTDNCLYSNGVKVLTSHDGNDDTKNTTGTTNKASTKLFLAGAETQASYPVTYSNSNCYIGTDNCLYSNGAKVSTSGHNHNDTYFTETESDDRYVKKSGDTMTGNLILHSDSGDSPYLKFNRGTDADNLCDWTIIDNGGYLRFKETINGTTKEMLNMCSSANKITSYVPIEISGGGKFIGDVTGNCSGSSGSCTGNAATATTATNLASKPVLSVGPEDGKTICVTAGGKTSDYFTVPYATSAGSATNDSLGRKIDTTYTTAADFGDFTNYVESTFAYKTGSLKNPNAIKFKNTSGTVITYDGSSAADLSGGVYYAATAGRATSATSATTATNANNVKVNTSTADSNLPILFTTQNPSTGTTETASNRAVYVDSEKLKFYYNPNSNRVTCAGGFFETSDERLKDIVNPITVDLDKLSKLRKVYFNWKDKPDSDLQLGMIAQDVQELYPELVSEADGQLSLSYEKLSVVALEAIDVLHNENNELKSRIERLESLVNQLAEKVND